MRVELSTAFAVLAHELRGCTSVIQGYVRLLQQSRGAEPADAALLAKLMDATSRLTTIGKQATDLATWSASPEANDEESIPMAHLVSEATAFSHVNGVVVSLADGVAETSVATSSQSALIAAVGAVIGAVARNSAEQSARIAGAARGNGIVLTMRPREVDAPVPDDDDDRARAEFFGQGGQNLALILASHVLDAHGIRLGAAAARPPLIQLHFDARG